MGGTFPLTLLALFPQVSSAPVIGGTVPSPDTSAQGASVASQEAEARIAEAYLELRRACAEFSVAPPAWAGRRIDDANDAYVAAIRASERPKVEALIMAARQFDAFIQMVDSGMTVFPLDPEHEDSEQNVYIRVREQLGTAVANIDAARAGRMS